MERFPLPKLVKIRIIAAPYTSISLSDIGNPFATPIPSFLEQDNHQNVCQS